MEKRNIKKNYRKSKGIRWNDVKRLKKTSEQREKILKNSSGDLLTEISKVRNKNYTFGIIAIIKLEEEQEI